jgi:hypothetical protein
MIINWHFRQVGGGEVVSGGMSLTLSLWCDMALWAGVTIVDCNNHNSRGILILIVIIRLATSQRFSTCTPVSSTNKTDRHDITEILLKVPLNIINCNINLYCLVILAPLNPLPYICGLNLSWPLMSNRFRKIMNNNWYYVLSTWIKEIYWY